MPGHTKHNNPNFKLVIKQLLQSARKITSGKKNNRCRYLAIEYTLVFVRVCFRSMRVKFLHSDGGSNMHVLIIMYFASK